MRIRLHLNVFPKSMKMFFSFWKKGSQRVEWQPIYFAVFVLHWKSLSHSYNQTIVLWIISHTPISQSIPAKWKLNIYPQFHILLFLHQVLRYIYCHFIQNNYCLMLIEWTLYLWTAIKLVISLMTLIHSITPSLNNNHIKQKTYWKHDRLAATKREYRKLLLCP